MLVKLNFDIVKKLIKIKDDTFVDGNNKIDTAIMLLIDGCTVHVHHTIEFIFYRRLYETMNLFKSEIKYKKVRYWSNEAKCYVYRLKFIE